MFPLKDDNPTQAKPFVTIALILANLAVFLWQWMLPDDLRQQVAYQYGLVPAYLTHQWSGVLPPPVTVPALGLVTSLFLHGGLMHVGGNMLYLWVFGNNVEDMLGSARFLAFYLLCGVLAALTQVVMAPASPVPMVGASGAIAGVLGAYALLFPHARVLTLIPIIFILRLTWVPAILVLGFWFVLQLFNGLGGLATMRASHGTQGGVAFFAHIGGFVAGMVLLQLFRQRRGRA